MKTRAVARLRITHIFPRVRFRSVSPVEICFSSNLVYRFKRVRGFPLERRETVGQLSTISIGRSETSIAFNSTEQILERFDKRLRQRPEPFAKCVEEFLSIELKHDPHGCDSLRGYSPDNVGRAIGCTRWSGRSGRPLLQDANCQRPLVHPF